MSRPRVSVVVSTRNRPGQLRVLVGALEAQDMPGEEFEVVLVDDASDPGGRAPDEAELGDGLKLRILRHDRPRGPAAGRNTGWRAAGAPLVAFTDDDCRPAPGWLQALLDAWQGDERLVVQGRVCPDPEQRSQLDPLCRTQQVGGPSGYFEACNIAYPRSLLQRLGGFDESFGRPCGEDLDLGRRAMKAGARLGFSEHALVFHAVSRPSLWTTFRHTAMWTDAVRVLKRHPELRDQLVGRLFWKPSHPRLLAALGAAVLATVARRPAVAVAGSHPYLAHYRQVYAAERQPWLAVARRLPKHLAIDLVEVGTMVAGSLRHGSLML